MSDVPKKIEYFVMDVDGTLTDGKIYMGENGEACKAFNVKDGYGICHLLPTIGAKPIIITGRKSKILENRCRELVITELYQGVRDKTAELRRQIDDLSAVAYIGDDLNDLSCMQTVKAHGGLVGCPSDAADAVAQMADFVSVHAGGNGAVREFIEWLIDREEQRT